MSSKISDTMQFPPQEPPITSRPEYVSNDILERDFLNSFYVLFRLQFVLGSCRVDPKDLFVTAPTVYQKCYTVLLITITMITNILVQNYALEQTDRTLYILNVTILWIAFFSFCCCIIHVRLFNGQSNAEFIIQLQKVDRLMGLDKINDMNDMWRKLNLISAILVLATIGAILIAYTTKLNVALLGYLGPVYGQLSTMVELIFCSNLVVHFVIRIRFINCIMINHLKELKNITKKQGTDKAVKKYSFSKKCLKALALKTHNFVTSDTNSYLRALFDCFTMFQNLYRFQLFVFCLKLVFKSLISFAIVLISIQKNTSDLMDILSTIAILLIDIFTAIFLGIRLQLFFEEVKETKRLAISVMAEYSDGSLREKARKMLKITEETPPRFSVYGMWEMNAGIVLTIFGLITSLIVTFLQFAFL